MTLTRSLKCLNILNLTICLAVAALSGAKSFAAEKSALDNFVSGKYALAEGDESLCSDGDFHVEKDGKILWLGPYYSFKTHPGSETSAGGFAVDKGCKYVTDSKVSFKGRESTFVEVSTLLCGTTKRQVITNTAVITKDKITLDQSSTFDPKYYEDAGGTPHSCVWKKSK